MSYFIANSLTISKDFKQFKMKGGDNNLVPRSNIWTDWINIDNLLDMLSSGSVQFGSSNNEKFLMLTELSIEFKNKWGGDWNKETDLYHSFRKETMSAELKSLNTEFLRRLKIEYKGITKKQYYVHVNGGYISHVSYKRFGGSTIWFGSKHSAKKFGKYQAERLRRCYSHVNAEIVTELKDY